MPHNSHSTNQQTLASLVMQWLVLVVIAFGMNVSSIGMTSSHGVAALTAPHESAQAFSDNYHGHVHTDPGIEFLVADESSSGEHPHHGIDHSHDTAHPLLLAWAAISSQRPGWEVMVRPRIDMGQAFRLDRPPMG
jgi:hypothetical protein